MDRFNRTVTPDREIIPPRRPRVHDLLPEDVLPTKLLEMHATTAALPHDNNEMEPHRTSSTQPTITSLDAAGATSSTKPTTAASSLVVADQAPSSVVSQAVDSGMATRVVRLQPPGYPTALVPVKGEGLPYTRVVGAKIPLIDCKPTRQQIAFYINFWGPKGEVCGCGPDVLLKIDNFILGHPCVDSLFPGQWLQSGILELAFELCKRKPGMGAIAFMKPDIFWADPKGTNRWWKKKYPDRDPMEFDKIFFFIVTTSTGLRL